ncbi:hypothetical protein GS506_06415 [Rhodococcus hoagii]|nr:hypothetical protein [Prescottella equi]
MTRFPDLVPRVRGSYTWDFRPESRSDRPVPDSAPRFWNDPGVLPRRIRALVVTCGVAAVCSLGGSPRRSGGPASR